MVIMLMENTNDLGHHLTVLAKIHLFTVDQKSLLILANGSYWVNLFYKIKKSLIVRAWYSRIHILACRRGLNSFAFFSRIEVSMGQAWSQGPELLFALLPSPRLALT